MATILVTGGAGFIGTHACGYLREVVARAEKAPAALGWQPRYRDISEFAATDVS